MPECQQESFAFPSFDRRKIEGAFTGGEVSSDGGVQLLGLADRKLGLTAAVAKVLPDARDPLKIEHTVGDLLRQRIYALACGYEDLNDHDTLRKDLCLQSAVGRDEALASSPTLCRFENGFGRGQAAALHAVLFAQFVASFAEAPAELILDFDATDDRVHGQQHGAHFHGYYGDWCFLPLYVFCGEKLLVSYLRPSNEDGARHAWAILALLVKALRARWPGVKIIFRGDSGFCRDRLLRWCERSGVDYIVSLAKNARLLQEAKELMGRAESAYLETKLKQRHFAWLEYGAYSWRQPRRIIAKAEHTDKGSNPRFVVTTLKGDPAQLYDEVYCARGEIENRIKEQQLGLFADRTSCQAWWPNQFRLLLSSLAYVLLEAIRSLALTGTELARAQVGTIRLKLLKIGTVIVRNTRRIRFFFSSAFPYQALFRQILSRLSTA
jgi:hypothetical protein